MALVTRMMSPSRSPSARSVWDSRSGRSASSILSRSNAEAYLVQSSTSHPAFKKNSNQSVFGRFGAGDDRGGAGEAGAEERRLAAAGNCASGTLSSESRDEVDGFPLVKLSI